METIVERYRQAARAATAIMCDLCKPPPQESTKSCMDCSASYCNECFKIYHPWGTVKAQHEYVGPTTNFRPKVSANVGHPAMKDCEKGRWKGGSFGAEYPSRQSQDCSSASP